jgi:hypothetical protein
MGFAQFLQTGFQRDFCQRDFSVCLWPVMASWLRYLTSSSRGGYISCQTSDEGVRKTRSRFYRGLGATLIGATNLMSDPMRKPDNTAQRGCCRAVRLPRTKQFELLRPWPCTGLTDPKDLLLSKACRGSGQHPARLRSRGVFAQSAR